MGWMPNATLRSKLFRAGHNQWEALLLWPLQTAIAATECLFYFIALLCCFAATRGIVVALSDAGKSLFFLRSRQSD